MVAATRGTSDVHECQNKSPKTQTEIVQIKNTHSLIKSQNQKTKDKTRQRVNPIFKVFSFRALIEVCPKNKANVLLKI